MIIYRTTNLVNGKIYIGKASAPSASYLGSGKLIKQAVHKYGENAFIRETIDIAQTKEDLCNKEKFWIAFYGARDREVGYNILEGGEGASFIHTEEARKKISDGQRGRILSKETRLKIAKALKGKKNALGAKHKMSEETKNKLRGRELSLEHKKNISKSMLNHYRSL